MKKVIRARSKNVMLPIEWNTKSQPLNSKGGNTLASYIGLLVRQLLMLVRSTSITSSNMSARLSDNSLRDADGNVNLKPPTKYANLIDEANCDVASFGSSDVANFSSSNVASFGSSNVANFGSSYVAWFSKYQSWDPRLSERFSPGRERLTWEGEILHYTGEFSPERELSRLGEKWHFGTVETKVSDENRKRTSKPLYPYRASRSRYRGVEERIVKRSMKSKELEGHQQAGDVPSIVSKICTHPRHNILIPEGTSSCKIIMDISSTRVVGVDDVLLLIPLDEDIITSGGAICTFVAWRVYLIDVVPTTGKGIVEHSATSLPRVEHASKMAKMVKSKEQDLLHNLPHFDDDKPMSS
ncbi:hypothetical protein Lal_00039156 [Lupinus albus]|nr:hypothetical protein Lal_00039156 [Lupinus albus]